VWLRTVPFTPGPGGVAAAVPTLIRVIAAAAAVIRPTGLHF
jgi:hypothetical protein